MARILRIPYGFPDSVASIDHNICGRGLLLVIRSALCIGDLGHDNESTYLANFHFIKRLIAGVRVVLLYRGINYRFRIFIQPKNTLFKQ